MSAGYPNDCPRCGGGLKGVTTHGPGESFASPCGCRVELSSIRGGVE